MRVYSVAELRLMDSVASTLRKLDHEEKRLAACESMQGYFLEEEKAFRKIRDAITQEKRHDEGMVYRDEEKMRGILADMSDILDALDAAVDRMESTDNRAREWLEQRKALYKIKRLLYKAGKYEE